MHYHPQMRKIILLAISFTLLTPLTATAHQPVPLLEKETSSIKGPLLTDGTISFAVRAAFAKSNQKKGFRFALKEGELVTLQYLIVDKAPDNKLKSNKLPVIVLTSPSGLRVTLKINERTKFYEPFGRTNYLFLSRYSATAESGIYKVDITAKAKSEITIAVGDREVPGEVIRGAAPTVATPTPTPTASSASLTMTQVKINNSASSCWSVINGNVYDLTNWIAAHPGGRSAILSLCGVDGTNAFTSQHSGESRPESRLANYLLGKLAG